MTHAQIKDLASRLEGVDRLTNAERTALLRDLERHARIDLYGVARICKDHLKDPAALRLPTVIMAAERINRHFEARMKEPRGAVELYGEQDRQIRQPEDGRDYRGPIIGTTPNCIIQRDLDTGDYIVHSRGSLARQFDASEIDKNVAIHYPFKAIGGVGLVKEAERSLESGHENQLSHGHERTAHKHSMEMSR
ncbi:KfrB domain-containing protein [Achromobacter xylosoxidans]|uniref:KfrB domain-containing protein n=1 Tax=Alcaligenes xylosoxydans xylosoxydans TaxID=85698 RepID=UPI00292E917E|nr:hypothetical protein [Achromobacter xylosoxidans]WOB74366.1 hypothetical protein PZA07_02465 [Achromobacter xylosoxidans]